MMSSSEPPAANRPSVEKIAGEAAARIAAADAGAYEAQVAFAAGEFPTFFQSRMKEAQQRVQDEYQRIIESAPEGGDSQAGE